MRPERRDRWTAERRRREAYRGATETRAAREIQDRRGQSDCRAAAAWACRDEAAQEPAALEPPPGRRRRVRHTSADARPRPPARRPAEAEDRCRGKREVDRKSTRLNSSHLGISYA